ncbi:hypothetical protein B0H13DRAFT_2575106 [Mycena leptocephala]|nr:hypothetical protein B0H13DRAFT_2575106 [Mycena leptocephala]
MTTNLAKDFSPCQENRRACVLHPASSCERLLPDIHLAYGPMLIDTFCSLPERAPERTLHAGVFFNMILYMVFVGQALTYQLYRRDWRYNAGTAHGCDTSCVRVQSRIGGSRMGRKDTETRTPEVFYLCVVETLNTGFDMAMMYQLLVLQYGQQVDYLPRGAIPHRYASASASERILILHPASFHRPEPMLVVRLLSAPLFPPFLSLFPPVITTTPATEYRVLRPRLIAHPSLLRMAHAWRIWTITRMPSLLVSFALIAFGVSFALFLLSSWVKRYMAMHTKGGEVAIPSSKGGETGTGASRPAPGLLCERIGGGRGVEQGANADMNAGRRGAGIRDMALVEGRRRSGRGRGDDGWDGDRGGEGRTGSSCCACSLLLFAASFFSL